MDASESKHVPDGRQDDVQEKLLQALNTARLELKLHDMTMDKARLEDKLTRSNTLADSFKREIEELKSTLASTRSALASAESDLQRLQNTLNSRSRSDSELYERQAQHILKLDSDIVGERSTSRSLRSLLDVVAGDMLPREELWDTILDNGVCASTVEVQSQSGVLCNWLEPRAMDFEPARSFDGLNVHQLCCEAIMRLSEPHVLDVVLAMLLTKTASALYNASMLSEELCEKLAQTIHGIDLDRAFPFDVALALCQILQKVSERFPDLASPRLDRQFRHQVSMKLNADEQELLQRLVDGWEGNLSDQVVISCESEQVHAIAVVSSINAFLVIDAEYLRWVGCRALVRMLVTHATIKIDDEVGRMAFKTDLKMLDTLYEFSLRENVTVVSTLPSDGEL